MVLGIIGAILVMVTFAAILFIPYSIAYKATHKEETPKVSKIVTGYALRENELHQEISIERVVEQAARYNMRPSETKIWKHYSDWTCELVRDLNEYTFVRQPTAKESQEIDKLVEEYKKRPQPLYRTGMMHGYQMSGILYRAQFNALASEDPDPPESYYVREERDRLTRERCLEWKPEFIKKPITITSNESIHTEGQGRVSQPELFPSL